MGLLDPILAEILVCPIDKADLAEDEAKRQLICTRCGRHYPVDENGIPDMIVDDSPDEGGVHADDDPGDG